MSDSKTHQWQFDSWPRAVWGDGAFSINGYPASSVRIPLANGSLSEMPEWIRSRLQSGDTVQVESWGDIVKWWVNGEEITAPKTP